MDINKNCCEKLLRAFLGGQIPTVIESLLVMEDGKINLPRQAKVLYIFNYGTHSATDIIFVNQQIQIDPGRNLFIVWDVQDKDATQWEIKFAPGNLDKRALVVYKVPVMEYRC